MTLRQMIGWLVLSIAVTGQVRAQTREAPAAASQEPVRNIVLVHGAFVDGSSWDRVIALLQKRGYHVTAVQNPLTSLADDVAATRRVLKRQTGPTILVGHSWAGVVITHAAADMPQVVGLVYVAALAPDVGESVGDLMKRVPRMPAGASINADDSGFLWFDPATYRKELAADASESKARVLAASEQPIASSAFDEKATEAAWKTRPCWYALSTRDQAVSPKLQRWMAKRIGAKVAEIASSHLSPVSHAPELVRLIDQAAHGRGTQTHVPAPTL